MGARQGKVIILISEIKKPGFIIFNLFWLVNHLAEYTPGAVPTVLQGMQLREKPSRIHCKFNRNREKRCRPQWLRKSSWKKFLLFHQLLWVFWEIIASEWIN